MNAKTSLSLLLMLGVSSVAGAAVTGCSGSTASVESLDLSKATLRRAQSCEDLTAGLRADARSKLNRRIDAEIRSLREGYSYGYGYYGSSSGGGVDNAGAAGGAAPPPQAGGSGGTTSTPAVAPSHSDTETQVKGVDEADIVKTDGNRIYLLHGDKFMVVDSWPATALGAVTAATIEGQPSEMFVADGRVVVFSRVDGAPIYAAAGITPKPGYSDVYSPYGGSGGGVMMGGAPAGGGVAPPGGYTGGGGPGYTANPLTKITVLQISAAGVDTTRELYFEGDYSTSRRIGGKVRAILNGGGHGPELAYSPDFSQSSPTPVGDLRGGPSQPPQYTQPTVDQQIAAWEALRAKNLNLIAATTYADWVPSAFVKSGGKVTVTTTQCADFYVPTAGTTESGMTQIESIDLDAPSSLPRSTTILGATSTVYGNTNALVLASEAYTDPWVMRQAYPPPTFAGAGTATGTTNGTPASQPPPVPVMTLNYSHLHAFDIATDPTTALYVGSGTVPGAVKDQFALDEKNGAVRVATTENRSGPMRTDGKSNDVSHVYVLENHQGKLAITGDAGEIAPGEQLYATRFVGDKAYIVTWHVTDPLFVVDVADSHAPRIMGQVQIPGFSTYIHPLDDTHLLTIGRETDMTGHQHDGSYWYGIAIQVFDVTNPLQPKQQYKYVYDGGEYATTEAMDEHKAFTYFDDKKLLAFPYVHQGSYGNYGPSSTLEVFNVDVAKGITKVGSVDHSSLVDKQPNGNFGYCGGYFDGAVRRGIFVENVVYSISYGGIIASDVGQMTKPIAQMKLAAPTLANVCQ